MIELTSQERKLFAAVSLTCRNVSDFLRNQLVKRNFRSFFTNMKCRNKKIVFGLHHLLYSFYFQNAQSWRLWRQRLCILPKSSKFILGKEFWISEPKPILFYSMKTSKFCPRGLQETACTNVNQISNKLVFRKKSDLLDKKFL